MRYKLLLVKRVIEDVLMFPLILTGRMIALLKPLDREYRIFFFFPFYHTGGAEKIHALIAKASGGRDCIVFFTRKSQNATFLESFRSTGCQIRDISRFTDNKWIYFLNIIYRGLITGYINRQKRAPVVFNGQCNFGYKISPWVIRSIDQVELIHSFNSFSWIRIPFLPFYRRTVMISKNRIADHLQQYRRMGIPPEYDSRITYISNTSEFDRINILEKDFSEIRVMYSGRSTPEKRVGLVLRIMEGVHQMDDSIKFTIAGDVADVVDVSKYPYVTFHGNVSNPETMKSLYISSHMLLLTSETEGFPLAVIEAMAYGCAVLTTAVGDIPEHVQPGVNGYLFSNVEEENKIVEEGIAYILQLKKDLQLLKTISANNIEYAQESFSFERFANAYQNVLGI